MRRITSIEDGAVQSTGDAAGPDKRNATDQSKHDLLDNPAHTHHQINELNPLPASHPGRPATSRTQTKQTGKSARTHVRSGFRGATPQPWR